MTHTNTMSRRTVLRSAAQVSALGALAGAGLLQPGTSQAAATQSDDPPLIWVWKSAADGDLAQIRDQLASNHLGIILKTHDGTHWMEEYDDTHYAITGPAQVSRSSKRASPAEPGAGIRPCAAVARHSWPDIVQPRHPHVSAGPHSISESPTC